MRGVHCGRLYSGKAAAFVNCNFRRSEGDGTERAQRDRHTHCSNLVAHAEKLGTFRLSHFAPVKQLLDFSAFVPHSSARARFRCCGSCVQLNAGRTVPHYDVRCKSGLGNCDNIRACIVPTPVRALCLSKGTRTFPSCKPSAHHRGGNP